MNKKVVVLGGGAFGTAIANVVAENCEQVTLWCFENEVSGFINKTHENNRFLPDLKLSSRIMATNNLDDLITKDSIVFEAIPVKFMRSVLQKTKPQVTKDQTWVCLSKGMEQETFLLPSQIIDDVFGFEAKKAVLAGPTFAKELVEKKMTAAELASNDEDVQKEVAELLQTDFFKIIFSSDLIGIQVGGVFKNILTLLIGIAQGSGFGNNTKAMLLTKGFEQAAKLTVILGGEKSTIYGLSGFGDLILSASSGLSKNLRAGILIGQGNDLENLYKYFTALPEGLNAIESVYGLIKKNNLDLPVFDLVYKVVFEDKRLDDCLSGF